MECLVKLSDAQRRDLVFALSAWVMMDRSEATRARCDELADALAKAEPILKT